MKFRYKAELIEGKYNVIIANTVQIGAATRHDSLSLSLSLVLMVS